jgi:hypothetical protein
MKLHGMAVRCISSIPRLRKYVKFREGRGGYFLPKGASRIPNPEPKQLGSYWIPGSYTSYTGRKGLDQGIGHLAFMSPPEK